MRTTTHYYFALDHGDGTPAVVADARIANLTENAGTAVLAGTAESTAAAIPVPDGVSSVTVTDADGTKQQVPVVDNVAATERKKPFSMAFSYMGTSFEPIEIPKRPPDAPGDQP